MSITYRYTPTEGAIKEEPPTRGGKTFTITREPPKEEPAKTFTVTRETPAEKPPQYIYLKGESPAYKYPTIEEATRHIYERIDKDPEFYSSICELSNNQFCKLKSIMPADVPIEDIALSMFVQGIIAGNSQVIIRYESEGEN